MLSPAEQEVGEVKGSVEHHETHDGSLGEPYRRRFAGFLFAVVISVVDSHGGLAKGHYFVMLSVNPGERPEPAVPVDGD